MKGMITVENGKITVVVRKKDGWTECNYTSSSIENLHDAARVLGNWMDISFEDLAKECQRVSARDQFLAELRETIREIEAGNG